MYACHSVTDVAVYTCLLMV